MNPRSSLRICSDSTHKDEAGESNGKRDDKVGDEEPSPSFVKEGMGGG